MGAVIPLPSTASAEHSTALVSDNKLLPKGVREAALSFEYLIAMSYLPAREMAVVVV